METLAEAVQIELDHLLEVGHPETPAEVDHLQWLPGVIGGLERDLEDVAAVLEERLDLEDLGGGVDVDAPQDQLGVRERLQDRLFEFGLVYAELPDRPAHPHLGAHQLGGGVDPQAHPDPAPGVPGDRRQAVDLVQRLHVVREDAFIDYHPQLVVGLAGPGEDDVLGLEVRGPRHNKLSRRGYLAAGSYLPGYELAHPDARVGLQ